LNEKRKPSAAFLSIMRGLKEVKAHREGKMEYKGYIGSIEYDGTAKTYYGTVANSADIIHFAGETIPALERSFHDSVDTYLKAYAKEARNDE
jgi:predicted HicB family RNase H-like nuclease